MDVKEYKSYLAELDRAERRLKKLKKQYKPLYKQEKKLIKKAVPLIRKINATEDRIKDLKIELEL